MRERLLQVSVGLRLGVELLLLGLDQGGELRERLLQVSIDLRPGVESLLKRSRAVARFADMDERGDGVE